MVTKSAEILVADEVWIATAKLHRQNPTREAFTVADIQAELRRERAHPEHRPGLTPHIHLHCVANLPPNAAKYRMLYKQPDGKLRLYRTGDDHHPQRSGKTLPHRHELPTEYHNLLDWYQDEYDVRPERSLDWKIANDPLLQLRGSGKGAWGPDSDQFIRDLRAEWADEPGPDTRSARPGDLAQAVWDRLRQHEGESFETVTGLPFQYRLDGGTGVWFIRDGKMINQRLSRADLVKAVDRWPVRVTTELSDLRDPSYLFALLRDSRIFPAEHS